MTATPHLDKSDTNASLLSNAIIEELDVAVISKDLSGNITTWNKAATRLLGYTAEEMIGSSIFRIIPEDRYEEENQILRRLRNGEKIVDHKTIRWNKARQRIEVSLTISPIRDSHGEIIGASKMMRDISARKQAEEALHQSEKRFRSFVEATAQIIWRTNAKGEVDLPIPSWNAFTGQTDAESQGFGWVNAIHPEDRSSVVAAWQQANATQSIYETEYRLKIAAGGYHRIVARGVPVFSEDGKIIEYIGTCTDITGQRTAEAGQRKAEAETRKSREDLAHELEMTTALHKLAVGFVTGKDLNTGLEEILQTALTIAGTDRGTFQFFDPSTRALQIRASHGFSDEWLRFFSTVHGEDASCGEAMRCGQRIIVEDIRTSHVFAGQPSLQVELKEGVLAVQSTPLVGRSGQFLGMLSTHFREPHTPNQRQLYWLDLLARQAADLIEFSRAQESLQRSQSELREREAVLRTVTNEARVGLVMVDQQCRYLFANQAFADIHGLPNADIVGKSVSEVLPDHYDQIKPNLERGLAGERITYELHVREHPKTGEERFYQVVYEPRVKNTSTPYIIVVTADVTERKRIEQGLEKLVAERTAALSETVGELEAFSYTIAHDMRAPLRAMQSFAAMLIEEHGSELTERPRELLQRIANSASRLDHLILDVLNYSKILRAEFRTEEIDAHALMQEIIHTYPNFHSDSADITIANHLPVVRGNGAALTQVFSNLLGNAVKFVPKGQRPRVTIRSEPVPAPAANHSPPAASPTTINHQPSTINHPPSTKFESNQPSTINHQPSTKFESNQPSTINHPPSTKFTRLWFEDNGIGIAPAEIPKLFHMFHRAHSPTQYEGTGMGLAIVRKAVERMGGHAGVESELGKGSRFWIELPVGNGR